MSLLGRIREMTWPASTSESPSRTVARRPRIIFLDGKEKHRDVSVDNADSFTVSFTFFPARLFTRTTGPVETQSGRRRALYEYVDG
jgi:hypothetical protein